jgi:hypothetical protein
MPCEPIRKQWHTLTITGVRPYPTDTAPTNKNNNK